MIIHNKRILFLISFIVFHCLSISAQFHKNTFTRQDTLRGSITPEREWWDLNYYHLILDVNPENKNIEGSNLIRYKVLKEKQVLQIDLQKPLTINKVEQDGQGLIFRKDGNAWFIELKKEQIIGEFNELIVYYEGNPKVSNLPPWDGGFTWNNF